MSHTVPSAESPAAPQETGLTHGEDAPAPSDTEAGANDLRGVQIVGNLGKNATEAYFHGTNFPFEAGEKVYPGGYAINDKNGVLHASATVDEGFAWKHAEGRENLYGGRARVFKVVPSDGEPVRRLGPQHGEVNSRSFTVVDEIDVKPGRQGTFPGINWSKHTPYIGANHPEDPPFIPDLDWNPYVPPSPNDMTLDGLGEEYVKAEHRRIREESGAPEL
jgi:hypothetical protein